MGSLVFELQQNALDETIKLSSLLRKANVVATKLDIKDFQDWIRKELHGYQDEVIPEYRKVHGVVQAFDSYTGQWVPVIFQDPEIAKVTSERYMSQAIGELEGIITSHEKGGILTVPFPKHIENKLMQANNWQLIPMLVTDESKVHGILDTVRNIILEWSLKLEKDGILGDGLTFSNEEKQRASANTYNIQNFSGILGNVQSDNLQVGNYNSIHSQLKQLGVSQEERNELENILDALKTANNQQKTSLLKRGSEWVLRNADKIGKLSDAIRLWFEMKSSGN